MIQVFIDCYLVPKPGTEWVDHIPYVVPVIGLFLVSKYWSGWKNSQKILFVLLLVAAFVAVWFSVLVLRPRDCEAFL